MKEGTKKATIKLGIISGIVIAILFTASLMTPEPVIEEKQVRWRIIYRGAVAGEADPGDNESGFLEIFFINHTVTPNTAYDVNASATLETWCVANMTGKTPYATADNFNTSLQHSVNFNIIVRCRFNKTHAWDGAMFHNTSCRVNITLTGDITISDVTGTNIETRNDTSESYIWINTYWDNSGNGYILWKDETADITEISIEAKY